MGDERTKVQLGEWVRTGTVARNQWAYEYLKVRKYPVDKAFVPKDPKGTLLKAIPWLVTLQNASRTLKQDFDAMRAAWRQRERRQNLKGQKSCNFVLSIEALQKLQKLAGQHPQNKTLEKLIEVGLDARHAIKVERDLSEKQLAAARDKMNRRTNKMRATIDSQQSAISLLMNQVYVLMDKNSRLAVLLDANGLTNTPLSQEQEAHARQLYATEKEQIEKMLRGRLQIIAQRIGPFESRLQQELEQQRKMADEQIAKLLEITKVQQKAGKFLNTLIASYSPSDVKDPPEDTTIPTASPQEAASSKAPGEAVLTNIDASAASLAATTSTSKSPIVVPADHPGIPENNSLQRTNETMPSAIVADPASPADTPVRKPDTHKKVTSTHLGRPPKQISPAIKKK
jgi:hypothetical protein